MVDPILNSDVFYPVSPVARWTLDDTFSNIATDNIGQNDGILRNSPTFVPGVVNGAINFDGVDDFVEIADDSALNVGDGNFAISGWIKTDDTSGFDVIFHKWMRHSPFLGYALFSNKGSLALLLGNNAGYTAYLSSTLIADNKWHHFVVTVDRDVQQGIKFYADGQEKSSFSTSISRQGSLSNSLPLTIGGRSDNSGHGYFNGYMDEVAFFNTSLTSQNVRDIYQQFVNNPPTINPQAFSVNENSPEGTVIDEVNAIDPDGDAISLTITDNVDPDNDGNVAFRIEENQLLVNDSDDLNFEANISHAITVEASDGTLTDSAIATIDVIDVNEPPSIDAQAFTIAENSGVGTVVGTLEAIDPDGDSLSFSITHTIDGDDDGNATFRIEGNQLVVNDSDDLDFETMASLPITVAISDGTLTDETGVIVTLSDVDEIPEYIPFTIDFDTDALGNSLAAGTTVDTEYQEIDITVSTPGHKYGAMIFDTANVTGGDHDLADPGTGNEPLNKVLILSEDGNSDNPDDNAKGGLFRFEFDELVGVNGVGLFDIDAHESVEIRTFDELGDLSAVYTFNGAGDNALQIAEINSELITAMEVELTGSGAISWLEGDRSSANIHSTTSDVFQNSVSSEL